jgi:DNA-binding transcriptional MocR family regulator
MSDGKQLELFQAETTWFHVFRSMVDNGDVAKLGPFAVTVYLVIKAYTNYQSGMSFPSVETIAEKSGISERKVKSAIADLVEAGYLRKERKGRRNLYTLREKVDIQDDEGRPAAVATWDYLPSTVKEARAELKNFLMTGESDGKVVMIDNINLNINLQVGDNNSQNNFNLDKVKDKDLKAVFDRMQKHLDSK